MTEEKETTANGIPVMEENIAADPEEMTELSDDVSAESQLASLQTEFEKKDQQLQESVERVKRLQADFDNFRRRTRQEKEELSTVVAQSLIKDLLPLLDNFERALTVDLTAGSSSFKEGIEMICKQLFAILEKNGLEKINAVGAKFDPNFHEAIMRVADTEKEDDTIIEELQTGYSVRGRVIRPSMVKVVGN